MPPALEVWTLSGRRDVELDRNRVTIGKSEDNDLALDDATVSRLHAVLERFPAGWCVTDVGSSNGTFLNGERIWPSSAFVMATSCGWVARGSCSATRPTWVTR